MGAFFVARISKSRATRAARRDSRSPRASINDAMSTLGIISTECFSQTDIFSRSVFTSALSSSMQRDTKAGELGRCV